MYEVMWCVLEARLVVQDIERDLFCRGMTKRAEGGSGGPGEVVLTDSLLTSLTSLISH